MKRSLLVLAVALWSLAVVGAQEPAPRTKPAEKKAAAQPKAQAQVIHGKLTAKDDVEPAHGFRKIHRIEFLADQLYEIEIRLDQPGAVLLLRNGDGTALKPDLDVIVDGKHLFLPDRTGEYEVVVTTDVPRIIGDYTLWIQPAEAKREVRKGPPPTRVGNLVITSLPALHDDAAMTHGYFEHRFSVLNQSDTQTHQVTIWLPRGDEDHRGGNVLRSMRKSATIAPHTEMQLSLFQPFIRLGSNSVSIDVDGRAIAAEMLVAAVRRNPNGEGEFPVGMRSPSKVVWLNTGQNDRLYFQRRAVEPRGFAKGWEPADEIDPLLTDVPLERWTKNWLGLGAYDGVAVSGKALDAAPDSVQQALWQYVETGGSLFVLGPCDRLPPWSVDTTVNGLKHYFPGFGECLVSEQPNLRGLDSAQWLMLKSAPATSQRPWSQVVSASDAHRVFPVIENIEIPIRGLCAFMLGFVIVIGPVNMYVLSRLRRRIWLLWTVPVVSLLTTALLFFYVAFTDGWSPHLRADVVTVLDERTQRASSIGWLGYFSPTTSGSGLRFTDDTELSPHIEQGGNGRRRFRGDDLERSLTIDWTDDQHLEAGWLTAKVPLHFLVRRSHKQQERLQVRSAEGALLAVNGLGADIEKLWIADRDGVVHAATSVKAGVEAKLAATPITIAERGDGLRKGYAGNWLTLSTQLETNPEMFLRPGCYIAVTKEMPFVEPGVASVQTKRLRTVVFGILKDAP
jgi:hypothetical protein